MTFHYDKSSKKPLVFPSRQAGKSHPPPSIDQEIPGTLFTEASTMEQNKDLKITAIYSWFNTKRHKWFKSDTSKSMQGYLRRFI